MKQQQSNQNDEAAISTRLPRHSCPFLQLAEAPTHRKLRRALPSLPRRQLCLAIRALLAAFHAAELALWQASGGDVLRSSAAAGFTQARSN